MYQCKVIWYATRKVKETGYLFVYFQDGLAYHVLFIYPYEHFIRWFNPTQAWTLSNMRSVYGTSPVGIPWKRKLIMIVKRIGLLSDYDDICTDFSSPRPVVTHFSEFVSNSQPKKFVVDNRSIGKGLVCQERQSLDYTSPWMQPIPGLYKLTVRDVNKTLFMSRSYWSFPYGKSVYSCLKSWKSIFKNYTTMFAVLITFCPYNRLCC